MSVERVLAAAFKHHGRDVLDETEIVGAIALDRGWFTPDEVRQLIDRGEDEGHLQRGTRGLQPTFDVGAIAIPSEYEPDASVLRSIPIFERILDQLEDVHPDRRESVAGINELQADLGVSSDVAAVAYAHGQGLDVRSEANRVRRTIEQPTDR